MLKRIDDVEKIAEGQPVLAKKSGIFGIGFGHPQIAFNAQVFRAMMVGDHIGHGRPVRIELLRSAIAGKRQFCGGNVCRAGA